MIQQIQSCTNLIAQSESKNNELGSALQNTAGRLSSLVSQLVLETQQNQNEMVNRHHSTAESMRQTINAHAEKLSDDLNQASSVFTQLFQNSESFLGSLSATETDNHQNRVRILESEVNFSYPVGTTWQ